METRACGGDEVAVAALDEQNGEVLFLGDFHAALFAQNQHRGGPCVCQHGVVGQYGCRCSAVGHRAAGFGVQNVRETLTVLFEVVAVITRGGQTHVRQFGNLLQRRRGVQRGFHTNAPVQTIRVFACGDDIAAYFDHVILQAQFSQCLACGINTETFADGRQIDRCVIFVLTHLVAANLQHVLLPGYSGNAGDFGVRRCGAGGAFGAEAPEVDQRA